MGTVVSQSGALADLAADYRRALLLWQDEVNAAGGLLGRQVELRILDDGSDAARAGPLYRQLIEERAELLIGPFGSAATLLAAAEAERARRVLMNGAGPSGAIHSRKPRYVFQSTIPYAAYGDGVLELAKEQGLRTVFILARDDHPPSQEMAEAARDRALQQGLGAGAIELYGSAIKDFAPLVAKAETAQADAWIAFSEVRDSADMVRTFKRLEYAPRLFFARAAAQPKFIALVGQDAEFGLGVTEYDARFGTPGSASFVKAFTAKWSSKPGPAAAAGYATATVLAEAVRRAGTLDQEKLRAALAALETDTVLGTYRVDPATGTQIGMKPTVVQIVGGRPEIVAPEKLQPYPYPAWSERRVFK